MGEHMEPEYAVSFILLIASLTGLSVIRLGKASPTTVSVSPSSQILMLGDSGTVDVNIDFAENLSGYEVWLNFNNTILNATAIEYRGYLNEPTFLVHQEINNTGGYVALVVLSINHAPPRTGGSPPPLATVHFTAIEVGVSQLHLYKTKLADYQDRAIPHETSDGEVRCDVIPEFPPTILLPIFAVLTTFVVIIKKKSDSKRPLENSC
jgi:hypothetical protein